MLEACDIGHRVVVRHLVGDKRPGQPGQTDLLGTLIEVDERRYVVRTDAGAECEIARGDVTAAKRVPPRPPRFSEMLELERIADRAWPAPETVRLGEWLLRAAQGWTNRANSALPLGDSGEAMDETVEACVDWYAARGLTPRITVPLPVRRDVAADLAGRGWVAQPTVLVQTAPLGPLTAADVGPDVRPEVRLDLSEGPSPAFLARLAGWKPTPGSPGLPEAALAVLTGVDPVIFAEARAGQADELLATARGAVVDGWLHLGSVEVAPAARRQGLARAVTAAVAAWGERHGATRAVLQVEEDNEPAVGLYGRLGFTTHHRYVTYRAVA
jgi:ribosomal protein S18 acetylase RimI-like enzyme